MKGTVITFDHKSWWDHEVFPFRNCSGVPLNFSFTSDFSINFQIMYFQWVPRIHVQIKFCMKLSWERFLSVSSPVDNQSLNSITWSPLPRTVFLMNKGRADNMKSNYLVLKGLPFLYVCCNPHLLTVSTLYPSAT